MPDGNKSMAMLRSTAGFFGQALSSRICFATSASFTSYLLEPKSIAQRLGTSEIAANFNRSKTIDNKVLALGRTERLPTEAAISTKIP